MTVLLDLLFALPFLLFLLLLFYFWLWRSWFDEIYNRYLGGLSTATARLPRTESANTFSQRNFDGFGGLFGGVGEATSLASRRRARPDGGRHRQRAPLLVIHFTLRLSS